MIREKLKSEKGITLVALVITIVILLILTGVTITGINTSNNIVPYNNMIADITLLEEKISMYYNKYGEIPILQDGIERQIDAETYYEIDLSKLQGITLNYGTKYNGDEEDVYLVNNNLEVCYLGRSKMIKNLHLGQTRIFEL